MDLSLRTKPARLCLSRLEMTEFSRMSRIPKIPVARRSSVSRAKLFLIFQEVFSEKSRKTEKKRPVQLFLARMFIIMVLPSPSEETSDPEKFLW